MADLANGGRGAQAAGGSGTAATDARDRPVGELVKELSAQTSTLVRKEIELARAELEEKGKVAGKGAGMLAGAAVFGLLAMGALSAALIALLDKAMATWVAALIVMALWAIVALVLAKSGQKALQRATPPAPQTIETVKEDIQWAKNPTRIRAEIEQTRAEMSETVDALGHKADVKTRAKENLAGKRDAVKEGVVGVKDKIAGAGGSATSAVGDKTPDAREVKHKARRAASVAQQNPLGLALGSVAVGVIAGMLIPSTRVEDEQLGEMSDTVVGKVKETGQDALEHGKQVAQDAVQSAQETAKESGQEHARQVKDTAKENAQDATSSGDRPPRPSYQPH